MTLPPMPLARRPAWEHDFDQWYAALLRAMLETGCSWRQAWEVAHERRAA